MPTTAFPVLIITILLFTVAFSISIWCGIFLAVWLIASITWFWQNIGNKNDQGKWYDWLIGIPVLAIACLWGLIDKKEKSNDK
jgi:hypothetical protein